MKRSAFGKRGIVVGTALYSALLAVLLDLVLEPVAAHVVFYWRWLAQGPLDYYGMPLINLERGLAWRLCCYYWLLGRCRGGMHGAFRNTNQKHGGIGRRWEWLNA